MKKNNSKAKSPEGSAKGFGSGVSIGMDVGDKTSRYCVLNSAGEVVIERSVATTKKGMAGFRCHGAESDSDRSGNAFTLDEPRTETFGA